MWGWQQRYFMAVLRSWWPFTPTNPALPDRHRGSKHCPGSSNAVTVSAVVSRTFRIEAPHLPFAVRGAMVDSILCFLASVLPCVMFGSVPRTAEEPNSQGQRAAISPLMDENWSYSWQLTWSSSKETGGSVTEGPSSAGTDDRFS